MSYKDASIVRDQNVPSAMESRAHTAEEHTLTHPEHTPRTYLQTSTTRAGGTASIARVSPSRVAITQAVGSKL